MFGRHSAMALNVIHLMNISYVTQLKDNFAVVIRRFHVGTCHYELQFGFVNGNWQNLSIRIPNMLRHKPSAHMSTCQSEQQDIM